MDNALDKARFNFYLQHPESILRSEPWQVVAVCLRCKGENKPDRAVFIKSFDPPPFGIGAGCAVCGVAKIKYHHPIPHEIWRKRYHVLTEKPRFMRRPLRTGFWEYEKISSHS